MCLLCCVKGILNQPTKLAPIGYAVLCIDTDLTILILQDYQQYISVGSDDIPPQLKTDSLAIFSTLPQIVAFHRESVTRHYSVVSRTYDPLLSII